MAGHVRRVFVEDDPSVSVLLEEYKLHRAEAVENSAKNNRQVTYIQIYGLFLIAVAGTYYGFSEAFDADKIPESLTIPVLVIAASLLFYLYSQIYLSSFTFRVLRMRMAEVEKEINRRSKSKILRYEQEISPEFFGNAIISSRYISPNTWLQVFLLALFISAAYVISGLALALLDKNPIIALLFVGSIVFFVFTLIWENFKLSRPGAIAIRSVESTEAANLTAFLRILRYFLNYFVVLVVVFIFSFDKIDYAVPVYIFTLLNDFFAAVDSMSRTTVATLVAAYTALCALFLPTPSELPLRLTNLMGWPLILVASAIGKAIGATALMAVCQLYFRINDYDLLHFGELAEGSVVGAILSRKTASRAYFLCQSIPFLPMRSATVAYAAVSNGHLQSYVVVAVGSAVGTAIRMIIMWMIISLGILALPSFGVSP